MWMHRLDIIGVAAKNLLQSEFFLLFLTLFIHVSHHAEGHALHALGHPKSVTIIFFTGFGLNCPSAFVT
jgi:hypothetical protein